MVVFVVRMSGVVFRGATAILEPKKPHLLANRTRLISIKKLRWQCFCRCRVSVRTVVYADSTRCPCCFGHGHPTHHRELIVHQLINAVGGKRYAITSKRTCFRARSCAQRLSWLLVLSIIAVVMLGVSSDRLMQIVESVIKTDQGNSIMDVRA